MEVCMFLQHAVSFCIGPNIADRDWVQSTMEQRALEEVCSWRPTPLIDSGKKENTPLPCLFHASPHRVQLFRFYRHKVDFPLFEHLLAQGFSLQ